MSGFVRPAPDLAKIVDAWRVWTAGGDDVLPGRTMADLKIGGVDLMLETLASDTPDAVSEALAAWNAWERGRVGPAESLAALAESGFGEIVAALEE